MNETERDGQEKFNRLCVEAFELGRFVLEMFGYDGRVKGRFTPTYEEAELFLRVYVAPFVLGRDGAYQHNAWRAPMAISMESEKRGMHWSSYQRWRDIESVMIFTETEDQRVQLDNIVRDICGWMSMEKENPE